MSVIHGDGSTLSINNASVEIVPAAGDMPRLLRIFSEHLAPITLYIDDLAEYKLLKWEQEVASWTNPGWELPPKK